MYTNYTIMYKVNLLVFLYICNLNCFLIPYSHSFNSSEFAIAFVYNSINTIACLHPITFTYIHININSYV